MTHQQAPIELTAIVQIDPEDHRNETRPPRPPELSELEKLLFPCWMDRDPATRGPNRLGHVAVLLPLSLLVWFATMAMLLAM